MKARLVAPLIAVVLLLAAWGLGHGGGYRAIAGAATNAYRRAYIALAYPAINGQLIAGARGGVTAAFYGPHKARLISWDAWMSRPARRWSILNNQSRQSRITRALVGGEVSLVGLITLFVGAKPLWLLLTRLGRLRPSKAHGSARFATRRELARLRSRPDRPQITVGTVGRQTVAFGGKEQYQSMLVFGPPAAGKSAGLIIPNLLEETGQRSIIVTDLKGELVEKTYAAVARRHDARVLNFVAPGRSCAYNPLAHIDDYLSALAFASTWVANTGESKNEPYWDNSARLIIAASVLHIKHTWPDDATISRLAWFLTRGSETVSKELQASGSPEVIAASKAWLEDAGANDKLISGVFSEMPLRFSIFQDARVRAVTSRNEIDFRAMGEREGRPTALYLVLDRALGKELRPLTAVFFTQLFNALIAVAEETPGGELPRPVYGYLDEMGNIGQIYNFPTYMSTVRSALMGFMLAFQHSGQIKDLYGEEGKAIILTCCNVKVALSKTMAEDAKSFSEWAGDATVLAANSGDSRKRGEALADRGNRGYSESSRKLVTPDEVTRLPEDQMLILSGNRQPSVITQRRYYRIGRLRKLSALTWRGSRVPPSGPRRAEPLEAAPLTASTVETAAATVATAEGNGGVPTATTAASSGGGDAGTRPATRSTPISETVVDWPTAAATSGRATDALGAGPRPAPGLSEQLARHKAARLDHQSADPVRPARAGSRDETREPFAESPTPAFQPSGLQEVGVAVGRAAGQPHGLLDPADPSFGRAFAAAHSALGREYAHRVQRVLERSPNAEPRRVDQVVLRDMARVHPAASAADLSAAMREGSPRLDERYATDIDAYVERIVAGVLGDADMARARQHELARAASGRQHP